jgi:hypothetical protein
MAFPSTTRCMWWHCFSVQTVCSSTLKLNSTIPGVYNHNSFSKEGAVHGLFGLTISIKKSVALDIFLESFTTLIVRYAGLKLTVIFTMILLHYIWKEIHIPLDKTLANNPISSYEFSLLYWNGHDIMQCFSTHLFFYYSESDRPSELSYLVPLHWFQPFTSRRWIAHTMAFVHCHVHHLVHVGKKTSKSTFSLKSMCDVR